MNQRLQGVGINQHILSFLIVIFLGQGQVQNQIEGHNINFGRQLSVLTQRKRMITVFTLFRNFRTAARVIRTNALEN